MARPEPLYAILRLSRSTFQDFNPTHLQPACALEAVQDGRHAPASLVASRVAVLSPIMELCAVARSVSNVDQ